MPDLDDHERRLRAVEEKLHMEAGLRAAVDNDLSSLVLRVKALHQGQQAIATTQSEHTALLNRHSEILEGLAAGQTAILRLLERLAPDDPS